MTRLQFDLNWAEMSDGAKLVLERRADEGKYVSFIHDYPDLPGDVFDVYEAFIALRGSTSGDLPIGFTDKLTSWEVYGTIDFQLYLHFIETLDAEFLKRQESRREKQDAKRKQEAEAERKAGRKQPKEMIGGRNSPARIPPDQTA